jgi:hypothetical protein
MLPPGAGVGDPNKLGAGADDPKIPVEAAGEGDPKAKGADGAAPKVVVGAAGAAVVPMLCTVLGPHVTVMAAIEEEEDNK